MWLTPTNGTSHTSANALAALTPTKRAPARPGPMVAATASTPSVTPPSTRASAVTGVRSSTWARLAISGTTPPKRAWRSTWLETTDERMAAPLAKTAAAVSSQDVSMPRTRKGSERASGLAGNRRDVAVVDGHHQARVAGDDALDARHVVHACATQGELAHEQAERPRPRIHLHLDAHH